MIAPVPHFKRLLINVIVLFFIICSANLRAQNLDFKYKIDSVRTENIMQYNITITIVKGTAPFKVRLFEDFGKANFEKMETKENIQTKEVLFVISKRGKYMIVVDDDNNNSLLKRLNLVNNQRL